MPTYHAVYCRTGFTGDQPQAIFRYSADAEQYAAKQAGRPDFAVRGYTVEPVEVTVRLQERA